MRSAQAASPIPLRKVEFIVIRVSRAMPPESRKTMRPTSPRKKRESNAANLGQSRNLALRGSIPGFFSSLRLRIFGGLG